MTTPPNPKSCPICGRLFLPLSPQPNRHTWTSLCPTHPTIILIQPRPIETIETSNPNHHEPHP